MTWELIIIRTVLIFCCNFLSIKPSGEERFCYNKSVNWSMYWIKHRAIKACGEVEILLHMFLNLALAGGPLVQRSPTDCGAPLCVIKKPRGWGGHSPRWAAEPEKIIIITRWRIMWAVWALGHEAHWEEPPPPIREADPAGSQTPDRPASSLAPILITLSRLWLFTSLFAVMTLWEIVVPSSSVPDGPRSIASPRNIHPPVNTA
jgi:hypothetical protein